MRKVIKIMIACIMIFSACRKDDFQYSFETPSKLLVSIKENGQLVTEFKYDSINRLIQADRYLPGVSDIVSQYLAYDSKNRLISISSGEYTEDLEYSNDGRLVTMILHFESATDGYEWEQKTELQYSNGKISRGIIFSKDGVETGYINYKYDSGGNTTERTEYSVSSDYRGMIISQFKYIYDGKINPNPLLSYPVWGLSQVDIIQGNNPIRSYYYNIAMSSFPPQYEFSYDYDISGLPTRVYIKKLQEPESSTVLEYEYEYTARVVLI